MGLAVLVLYCLLVFSFSAKAIFRKDRLNRGTGGETSCDTRAIFFVNARSGSALDVALSIVVSCIGASATIGMIGLAFKIGTPAFWWLGSGCFGLTLLSLMLARKVRDSGAYTMPQLVETYLGRKAGPLIAALIVTAWMAILAAQFVALAGVLRVLTGLSASFCLAISFGLVVFHTLGGQAAIMRVDRLQAVILLAILVLFLLWLSAQNPGWAAEVNIELINQDFPVEKLIYFFLIVGGNYLICPMLFGRFLSAENGRQAKLGGLIAVGGLALGAVIIISVGLTCRGLVSSATPGDQVLSAALSLAPGWINVLMSLALVSAIVSSADSCLLTAATVLTHDLLKTDGPATGRRCILSLGLVGLGLSLWDKEILDYLLMAYDVYVCGVVVPVFIGMVMGVNKISPGHARDAVVAGGLLGAASALSGLNLFSYAGMLISMIICLLGTQPHPFSR